MITCANCTTEAVYQYSVTKSLKINYCVRCMPSFLKGKKDSSLKVKLITKTVESPVEESVEEAVEEKPKPAPKKRAPKKKKVEEPTDGAD